MEFKNLAKKNHSDVTVFTNGDCFISQSAISRVTGIPRTTLQGWIYKKSAEYNTNELNQLDAESMEKLVIFGSRKYDQCFQFMTTLIQAGSKAYIYNLAGLSLGVTNPVVEEIPTTRKGLLELALSQETELEQLREKVRKNLPDVIFSEKLDGCISMNALAKLISSNTSVDIGANRLFTLLREKKILLGGRSQYEKNLPAQRFVKHFPVTLLRSEHGTSYTTSVSELGVQYVVARIEGWLEKPMLLPPAPAPLPPAYLPPPPPLPPAQLVITHPITEREKWVGWSDQEIVDAGHGYWK